MVLFQYLSLKTHRSQQRTKLSESDFYLPLKRQQIPPPKTDPKLYVISVKVKRQISAPNNRLTNNGVKKAEGLIKNKMIP